MASSLSLRAAHDPRQNRLFAALPENARLRLLPHLELIQLPVGNALFESGMPMSHAYLPTTAIVSLLYVMEDGGSVEVSMVGNDGVVGIPLVMGGETTPHRAVVQSAGYAYRLNCSEIKEEFRRDGPTQRLLLRYIQVLLTQMAQTAVCNRHHSLDQQLCRCLLSILDRLPSNKLVMTQELIASLLGVRREGVTEAAGNLQKAGLIMYNRGHITVLDRARLEARSCECYAVLRNESNRLLPGIGTEPSRFTNAGKAHFRKAESGSIAAS